MGIRGKGGNCDTEKREEEKEGVIVADGEVHLASLSE